MVQGQEAFDIEKDYIVAVKFQIESIKNDQKLGKNTLDEESTAILLQTLEIELQYAMDSRLARLYGEEKQSIADESNYLTDLQKKEEKDLEIAKYLSLLAAGEDYYDNEKRVGTSTSSSDPIEKLAFKFGRLAVKKEECHSCYSKYEKIRTAECQHKYCDDCVSEIMKSSLNDRSLIPARCCKKPFPEEWITELLSEDDYQRYAGFLNEMKNIVKINDPEYQSAVLALGWKICKNCGIGVERKDGCSHMTCSCSFEFCYRCSADWVPRQCDCPMFTEEELNNIIVEVAPRAGRIEQERIRNVYRNHDFHVHHWTRHEVFDRRMKKCPCGWVCNMWYWRCEGCRQNSCGTCAFNRL